MRHSSSRFAFVGSAVLCWATSVCAQPAAPSVSPDDAWRRYDSLLRALVHPDGVDVRMLRGRLAEVQSLHAWLADHGPHATPTLFATPAARKAYWINAYNLTVLRGIGEAPASVDNLLTWLPDGGFFRARTWSVDGRARTLDQIENTEVRPVFHDPRVHMALNCGARSCPPLRAEAYVPARLDAQLDDQSRRYVNRDNAVRVDEAHHTVSVSQLLEWFRDDFALAVPGHPRSPMAGALGFVHVFAAPPLRARLEAACGTDGGACTVAFDRYDWSLARSR